MIIKGIESGLGISEAFPITSGKGAKSGSIADGFGKILGESIEKVNNAQLTSDKAVQDLASGETKSLHEVVLAVEKANISFQLISQVRNKAIEAYQEIMRMPV